MLKKGLFEISDQERKRILNLHETATKKLYILKEDIEEILKNTPDNTTLGYMIFMLGKKNGLIPTNLMVAYADWFKTNILNNSEYSEFVSYYNKCSKEWTEENRDTGALASFGNYIRNNKKGKDALKLIDDWMINNKVDWKLTKVGEYDPALADPETLRIQQQAELERQYKEREANQKADIIPTTKKKRGIFRRIFGK